MQPTAQAVGSDRKVSKPRRGERVFKHLTHNLCHPERSRSTACFPTLSTASQEIPPKVHSPCLRGENFSNRIPEMNSHSETCTGKGFRGYSIFGGKAAPLVLFLSLAPQDHLRRDHSWGVLSTLVVLSVGSLCCTLLTGSGLNFFRSLKTRIPQPATQR